MRCARCLLSLLALVSIVNSRALAADSSPSGSRDNWFSFGSNSDSKAAKTKKVSNASSTTTSPSVIKQMADAPKRLVSNTKSMLTPKSKPAEKSVPIPTAKNPKESQQGFFKSMFNPDPPPPPQTIKEWMKLKQIHP